MVDRISVDRIGVSGLTNHMPGGRDIKISTYVSVMTE